MFVFPSNRFEFPVNQLILYKNFDFLILRKNCFFHAFVGTEQVFMLFRGWNFYAFFKKMLIGFKTAYTSYVSFWSCLFLFISFILLYFNYIYMKLHQAFTEEFYGANVGGPSKYQNIHDSFRVWLLGTFKFH